MARALLQHNGLMVITNNLNVASLMRAYPQIEVVIAGGVVRHTDGGIVGEAAVDFIRQFKVDFAVIGASAIDEDGALLDYDYREVRVAQAILSNARQVMLVCDSSKFERSAPVRIGHLSQVATFVTDRMRVGPHPADLRRKRGRADRGHARHEVSATASLSFHLIFVFFRVASRQGSQRR